MKKAFTLLEVVFVIVIMAVLALMSSDLLLNIYKNYIHSRSVNELEYKTDIALEQIAKRLQYRLKGSEIARNLSSENAITDIKSGNYKSEDRYALEWINMSYETQNIISTVDNISKMGWSGVTDITSFVTIGTDNKTTFFTPGSNLNPTGENNSFTDTINSSYYKQNGVVENGVKDFGIYFVNKNVADINNDFGYGTNHNKIAIANISSTDHITITVPTSTTPLKTVDDFEVSDKYYLLNTAYAVVPLVKKDNAETRKQVAGNNINQDEVFDLWLHYNYRPWNGESFLANTTAKSLLAENVSLFRFTKTDNDMIVMKLCMRTLDTDEIDFTVCKTKAVY